MKKTRKFTNCTLITFIILILTAVIGLQFIAVTAESNYEIVANVKEMSIYEQSRILTNQNIIWTDDQINLAEMIPAELFKQEGLYGYIGKKYGFIIKVTQKLDKFSTSVMLLKTTFKNNNNQNLIKFNLEPYKNYEGKYDVSSSISDIKFSTNANNKLSIGNLYFMPQLNTIHELSPQSKDYNISNDNSMYITHVSADYNLVATNPDYTEEVSMTLLSGLVGAGIDTLAKGIPVSSLLNIIMVKEHIKVMQKGVNYYGNSYETQVSNKLIETACEFALGKDKFLRVEEDSFLEFTIQYDNKLHSKEDFQVGFCVGFDVYDYDCANKLNEEMFYSTGVHNMNENETDMSFELKNDIISLENNKFITKKYANRFWNNGRKFDLEFNAPNTRLYDLMATENTYLSENIIDAEFGRIYTVNYDLNSELYGEIFVDSHYAIKEGSNKLYEGYSKFDFNINNTDAYKFVVDSEIVLSNMYITDELDEIITKTNDKNIITYVLQKNKNYKFYIKSNHVKDINLIFDISNEQKHSIFIDYQDEYYFSHIAKLNSYVTLQNCNLQYRIYDSHGNWQNSEFLIKGNIYFFKIYNGEGRKESFELIYLTNKVELNKEKELSANMNQIMEFDCLRDFNYVFNGYFDVYCDNEVIENKNNLFMQKGKKYYFINNYGEKKICVEYNRIKYNLDSVELLPYNIYEFDIVNAGVYSTENFDKISIYDIENIEYNYEHGYILPDGKYFMVAKENTRINFEEIFQEFVISLRISENETEQINVIYGHEFKVKTIKKEGYGFNGWMYNGTRITDSNGDSLGVYKYFENIEVEPLWYELQITLCLINDETLQWMNENGELVNSETFVNADNLSDLMGALLNFAMNSKREGYYKESIEEDKITTETKFVVNYKIIWAAETYKLCFNEFGLEYTGTINTKMPIDEVNKIIEIQNDQRYQFNGWYYEYGNQNYDLNFIAGQSFIFTDFNFGDEVKEQNVNIKMNKEMKSCEAKIIVEFYEKENKKSNKASFEFVTEFVYMTKYNPIDILENVIDFKYYEFLDISSQGLTFDRNANQMWINVYEEAGYKIIAKILGKDYDIIVENLYGDSIQEFPKTYNTANPKMILPHVYKVGYNHSGWQIYGERFEIGKEVIIQDKNFGNIVININEVENEDFKALFDFKWENFSNGESRTFSNNDKNKYTAIYIDLASVNSNINIKIIGNINYLEIKGNSSEIKNVYIGIDTITNVKLKLIDCNLVGRERVKGPLEKEVQGYVINDINKRIKEIIVSGTVTLKQADFIVDDDNINRAVIMTGGLSVNALTQNSVLNIYAGNGAGNIGLNGISSGSGWIIAGNEAVVLNANVNIYGGNGANGLNGANGGRNQAGTNGGNGGHAGYGFKSNGELVISSGYKLVVNPGKPGNGGRGGDGGTGVTGGNGHTPFAPMNDSTVGGKGGNGGNGGYAYSPIKASTITGITNNPTINYSRGGDGGTGGIGGAGDTTAHYTPDMRSLLYYIFFNPSIGGKGGDGGAGYIGGNGGNGGTGGKGYDGVGAVWMGPSGSNGGDGATGGNGGRGGNSYISAENAGKGGSPGNGGDGGAKGLGMFKKYYPGNSGAQGNSGGKGGYQAINI